MVAPAPRPSARRRRDSSAAGGGAGVAYAHVYGVDPAAVGAAAEHRVVAMDLSDRWIGAGGPLPSALVEQERAALVRSYAALLAAVHVVTDTPEVAAGI